MRDEGDDDDDDNDDNDDDDDSMIDDSRIMIEEYANKFVNAPMFCAGSLNYSKNMQKSFLLF